MENQSQTNLPESNVADQPVEQPQINSTNKTNLLIPIIITFLTSALIFGLAGYYLGTQNTKSSTLTQNTNIIPSPSSIPVDNFTNPTTQPTQQPSVTVNPDWNTYSNTKYNYSVAYPQVWDPNRGPGNLSDSELVTQRDIDFYDPTLPGSDPGTGFSIRVNELDANGSSRNCASLDDCFSKTFSWLTESTEITKTNTTFLGQPAITFSYQRKTDLYTQSWKYMYFIYDGNAYNIQISTNITRENEIFNLFDEILSTIHFR